MIKNCEICGKPYEYCPTCPRDMYKPTWMHRFDTDKCKKLWDVLSANGVGESSDVETASILNEMDYQAIGVTNEAIKAHIDRVMAGAANPTVEDVVNPPETTEVNADVVDETVDVANVTEAEAIEDAFNTAMDEIAGEEAEVKPKKRKGFRH